jgi:quercetin dioxygenase-like cupin family protein
MPIISRSDAPVFDTPGARFQAYAAPSRGASQISLWHIELAPGSTSPLHQMDCEEVFLALEGQVVATVAGERQELRAGDCLVLPPATPFTFAVADDAPFRALACMPAGGIATMVPGGESFAPPWAQ